MNLQRIRSFATLFFMSVAMFSVGGKAWSEDAIPSCPAPFDKLLSDEVFHTYEVSVMARAETPVRPNVKTGRARLYRTVIGEQVKRGPDFAGHYTIVPIGCGAATVCPAIVDSKTGKVWFPSELRSAEALFVNAEKIEVNTLNYRLNSRLLVVIGSTNEQYNRPGVSYYVWQDGRLNRIRFTPAFKLCGVPASTQFGQRN